MTAADIRYGRRGGHALPDGYVPGSPIIVEEQDEKKRKNAEAEQRRKAEQRAAVAAFELREGLVPGTAYWSGGEKGAPAGGMEWEGAARMAAARRAAGVPLAAYDRDALDRHPEPRSSFRESA